MELNPKVVTLDVVDGWMTGDVDTEDMETEDVDTEIGNPATLAAGLPAPSLPEESAFWMIRFRTLPLFWSS